MGESLNITESTGQIIYDFGKHTWDSSMTEIISTLLLAFTCLLVLCLLLSHYIDKRWKHAWLPPESAAIILLGMVVGGVTSLLRPLFGGSLTAGYLVGFSPTLFFVFLLPPIVLNAAYGLRFEFFFAEFKAIALLATVGCALSTLVVALLLAALQASGLAEDLGLTFPEFLTFGALVSATDPVSTLSVFAELRVDPALYHIVMGESLLNDAVGLTLFRTFSKFVGFEHTWASAGIAALDFGAALLGSALVGYLCACVAAYALRRLDLRDGPAVELGVFLLLAYVPFLVGEVCRMSGIVALLASGVALRRYAHPNLSSGTARRAAELATRAAARAAEGAVFLNLGLTVFNLDDPGHYHPRLIAGAVLACLVARGLAVALLVPLANALRTQPKPLGPPVAAMIWFAGLRGAVAFACATLFPDENGHQLDMVATTMVIVLFTVFVKGSLTRPMVDYFGIERGVDMEARAAPVPTGRVSQALLRFEKLYIFPLLLSTHRPSTTAYLRSAPSRVFGDSQTEEDFRIRSESIFGLKGNSPMRGGGRAPGAAAAAAALPGANNGGLGRAGPRLRPGSPTPSGQPSPTRRQRTFRDESFYTNADSDNQSQIGLELADSFDLHDQNRITVLRASRRSNSNDNIGHQEAGNIDAATLQNNPNLDLT